MQESNKNIALVILAAGSSSRMGSPKQLLKLGSKNLLNLAIEKAIKTSATEVIVVLGANFTLIKKEIQHQPIRILENKNWNLGLGKSIACAATYILASKVQTDGLLIVLADQPLISTKYLNEMIRNYHFKEKQIITTAYPNQKMGVPVLFDCIYFKELSRLKEDDGAKSVFINHKKFIRILHPPEENIDIDSNEDYVNFLKKYM